MLYYERVFEYTHLVLICAAGFANQFAVSFTIHTGTMTGTFALDAHIWHFTGFCANCTLLHFVTLCAALPRVCSTNNTTGLAQGEAAVATWTFNIAQVVMRLCNTESMHESRAKQMS